MNRTDVSKNRMMKDTPSHRRSNVWSLVADKLVATTGGPQVDPAHPAWIVRRRGAANDVWTYGDVANAIDNLIPMLTEAGVQRSTVVGLMAPNGPQWAVGAIALWRLGAIVAPVHIGNSDADIETQINALDPLLVLRFESDRACPRAKDIALNRAAAATGNVLPDQHPDQEATRIYTSGSTGTPKIVRLSHGNMASNVLASQKAMDIGISDRFLSLLPMSHAYEMTGGMLLALSRGATTVIPKVLAANEVMAAMNEEGVSLMIAVPRLYRNIMQGFEKKLADGGGLLRTYVGLVRALPLPLKQVVNAPIRKRFGRLRCWASGGSRLDPEISGYFRKLGISLRQGYGLTEASPVISVQDLFDPVLESVGPPLPGIDVKIHDPDEDQCGELWVRGPNVMMGYTDQELTDEVMQDGWLKTGDLARLTADGRIVLTGRCKRLIVTDAGKNVYPEELEVLLERYDVIKEAGVFEIDMKPVAVLAMDGEDRVAKAKATLKTFNAQTSAHNRITRFALTDDLPRTPLGKIALMALPQVFAEAEVTD